MKEIFSNPDFKLGILGGGQLGKMLLSETRRYDIFTRVMDPAADAPCRLAANEFVRGSLKDYDAVMNFAKGLDVLTIEIEHVNVQALYDLQKSGVKVFPQPQALEVIQNKARQKAFYTENKLPTSRYFTFASKNEMMAKIKRNNWPLPWVWKAAEGGYDGFGVKIVRSEKDMEGLPDGPGIVEEWIPFEKEIAVIAARGEDGSVVTYPAVEMAFHPTANQVEFVLCPAAISPELAAGAKKLAEDTIRAYDLVGLLAVEMFLTEEHQLLINEVAPRTHNSGHLTIESNFTSQFEQQLRAVCGMPLGHTDLQIPAVMANLVGEEGHSGPAEYHGYRDLLALRGVYLHLYGKSETRPFRKMGHVTVVNEDIRQARKLAEKTKNLISVRSRSGR